MEKNKKIFKDEPYIIAIGASAGGMEAIHLLFDNTPEDGVAYVIIQHLSPDHKSFMAELLEKHSKLQISVAENEMLVESNHVYLMPKGKNMTIRGRSLILADNKASKPHKSIDIFFDSLAKSHGDKSIAIILSGTGSDGTKGIATIKKNGGFVIVQDPASAKFDGMPNSAIDSGNVDVILSPDLIPDEIILHLKRDLLEINYADKLSEKNEAEFLKILGLIQKHTPLDFSEYRRPTIIRRIYLRMAKNKITSLADYADFLETNLAEINNLAKEFLISVTKFFRDEEAFEVIHQKIIPELVENKIQGETLKVWVVGCATGEEAYSLAILIAECLSEVKRTLEVKIFASDIDKSALSHASKGVYPESIKNDVSKDRLDKFFVKKKDHYKVIDNIRKMLIFADHNIVNQPPYGKIDLISCRNLLIYINPVLQKKILSSLHFCLNLEGYLFLGPSESLGDLKHSFIEVDKRWKIYKNIELVRNFRDTTYSIPGLDRQLVKLNKNTSPPKGAERGNLNELINHSLLSVCGYEAAIWIDTDFKILQTFGNFEKYLLPKIFNFNLLEMLPAELSIATSTTIHKVLKNEKNATIGKVRYKINDTIHSVKVFAKPFLSENDSSQTVILVLFSDDLSKTPSETEIFGIEEHTHKHIEDLKDEILATKLKLSDANIALDLSSEDISSYNEELISSNEEMQSVNEELQSLNEELQTVNNEYQLKIKELAELNDELNNYFRSTVNAQLYVDKDLVLRKFTPSAVLQINLQESDLGRVLSDISTKIRFSTLIEDIGKVISSSDTIEKEVQTLDGHWYQMVCIPYVKQQDNSRDGVIITFNDITEIKKTQDKLSRINADHNTFIYAVSHDLKGPMSNLGSIVSLLKEGDASRHDLNELVELLEKSTVNLNNIIHELSDIAKIESEIDVQEGVNLKELLNEVELSLKDKIQDSGAKIRLDLKEPEIQFSKKNLRRILFNLMSNAIKYKSPDRVPEVTIRTEKSNDFIILSIQDNGLGISEKKKLKIFGIFQRAHSHVEGSGIGLYLVKKTITNAGGDIEVESEDGKGSTFTIYFPVIR
ncbi:chemotaxis protein CheB [Algoriphagus sp. D3-2-R+10]|uniref:chemotaxis protein CheB n=1 Tax=Algoriphagus aurantiacus TaxID=3103948 RepID=UPI002B3BB8A2|nr:chemotaxis protein CheB [Algoriphagus sp. D3-2-R+10]MEB2778166.1 chemotaxis protein CheB [Algoriphagus sp. D3-2-R+10]